MVDTVYWTAVASLGMQVLLGLITASGYFISVGDDTVRSELNVIVTLEVVSQVIEFLWYAYFTCRHAEIRTWTRYIDWVLSTPVMILSTVLFFAHRRDQYELWTPFSTPHVYLCLAFNWLMLLFGFLTEVGKLDRPIGLSIGSLFFVASFTLLASCIAQDSLSIALFWVMYAVWAGYGLAATLPYTSKNVAYNVLDIVSKNFYGIFLTIYALTLSSTPPSPPPAP